MAYLPLLNTCARIKSPLFDLRLLFTTKKSSCFDKVSVKRITLFRSNFIRVASFSSGIRDWTFDDVVSHLLKPDTKNVVIMAGAGISTPSGIPDFR